MKQNEIKPCPVCNAPAALNEYFEEHENSDPSMGYYVACESCCYVEGPFDEDSAVAVLLWNSGNFNDSTKEVL